MQSLKDKVIVITGASYGLGKVLATRLATENAKLALIARSEEKLNNVRAEITNAGGEAHSYVCDLTNHSEITNTIEKVVADFGRIDILINNAGIWYEGPTEDHPKAKVKDIYSTNIIALINTTQDVIPHMKKQKSGQILNIASLAGVQPSGDWGIYTGSKYAVRGFTDSLRLELADSAIKVMGFYPPGMNTEFFNKSGFKKSNEPWMTSTDDIVEIITFMLKQPKDVNMRHVEIDKIFS